MKTNTAKRLQNKRVWLVLCVALVVLLASGVGIAAKQDHAQRMAAVAAQQAAVRKQADIATSTSSESLSRAERLNAVSNMANVTTPATDRCKGDWWSAWYTSVVADAGKEVAVCQEQLERIRSVTKIAARFDIYLDDDQTVAAAMKVITPTPSEDDWQTIAASSADSALRDIEAITITEDNKPLVTSATSVLDDIITAWAALNSASKAEDKAAYLSAKASLEDAYAAVSELSDVSDKQVLHLASRLKVATQKL